MTDDKKPPFQPITDHIAHIAAATGPGTVFDYILHNGRLFDSRELTPEEQLYSQQIQWDRRQPNECFLNCQIEALILPQPPGIELHYVEGFLSNRTGYPVLHAWLSINGKVVDPTVPYDGPIAKAAGIIPDGWQYYGVSLPTTLCEHAIEHGVAISLIDDWECHWPLIRGENHAVAI